CTLTILPFIYVLSTLFSAATSPPYISPLSLHDALPICPLPVRDDREPEDVRTVRLHLHGRLDHPTPEGRILDHDRVPTLDPSHGPRSSIHPSPRPTSPARRQADCRRYVSRGGDH